MEGRFLSSPPGVSAIPLSTLELRLGCYGKVEGRESETVSKHQTKSPSHFPSPSKRSFYAVGHRYNPDGIVKQ